MFNKSMFKALATVYACEVSTRAVTARQCANKIGHHSKGAAEASMRSLVKRDLHRPELGPLHPYPCRYCNRWHVGHRRMQ